MHKIDKFLSKLNRKNRDSIEFLIKKVLERKFDNLDNKKLKGFEDIFRVRKGTIRIVYQRNENKVIILVVDKRDDDTYNKF
ncbi:MAG: type II toxin-antitoxin system RelE/ParE family toxin [Patescibacteria group bacterium]